MYPSHNFADVETEKLVTDQMTYFKTDVPPDLNLGVILKSSRFLDLESEYSSTAWLCSVCKTSCTFSSTTFEPPVLGWKGWAAKLNCDNRQLFGR